MRYAQELSSEWLATSGANAYIPSQVCAAHKPDRGNAFGEAIPTLRLAATCVSGPVPRARSGSCRFMLCPLHRSLAHTNRCCLRYAHAERQYIHLALTTGALTRARQSKEQYRNERARHTGLARSATFPRSCRLHVTYTHIVVGTRVSMHHNALPPALFTTRLMTYPRTCVRRESRARDNDDGRRFQPHNWHGDFCLLIYTHLCQTTVTCFHFG